MLTSPQIEEYYQGLAVCADRYREMAAGEKRPDLQSFIEEYSIGVGGRLPLMKLNRWLGYIQGVLIEHGLTTVKAERDFTRPLFRHLDFGTD